MKTKPYVIPPPILHQGSSSGENIRNLSIKISYILNIKIHFFKQPFVKVDSCNNLFLFIMPTIKNLQRKYFSKISPSDLEILISHVIKKPGEFVLAHPECKLARNQELKIKNYAKRRIQHEPIAYIIGHKEFYGLDFKVNKDVLIPRPETETLVELVTQNLQLKKERKKRKTIILDIGTGCGNIIISVFKTLDSRLRGNDNIKFCATDISEKALFVAKQNAKIHKVDKKIKFLQGDLLEPIIEVIKDEKLEIKNWKLEIFSNLPYLSKKIYGNVSADIKKYEPKSALYSKNYGLSHYEKLFKQIKIIIPHYMLHATYYIEISPEQKNKLAKIIGNYFPQSKTIFHKDLSGKWRICEINITPEK